MVTTDAKLKYKLQTARSYFQSISTKDNIHNMLRTCRGEKQYEKKSKGDKQLTDGWTPVRSTSK